MKTKRVKKTSTTTKTTKSPVMRIRKVAPWTQILLAVRSGGRCEFDGCNQLLVEHRLTRTAGNFAQVAHIVAFSLRGPRGDARVAAAKINDVDNLMLLCPQCHKLIDDHPEQYTVKTLRAYKAKHERRIRRLTDMKPDHETTVVMLKANIGDQRVDIAKGQVYEAVAPYYPCEEPLVIDLTTIPDGDDEHFWRTATRAIDAQLTRLNASALDCPPPRHLSVFALGPIPVLVYLGARLGSKVTADVYQRHRSPQNWTWRTDGLPVRYVVKAHRRGSDPTKDGPEMKAIHERYDAVKALIRREFDGCSPEIRYGGSIAKGTAIRAAYDLDLPCYFGHDETRAGETIKAIYENMERAVAKKYLVERKTSALRLKDPNDQTDLRVDVVPGRFVNGDRGDVFLYQAGGEKERLKTNLDVHIAHVRDSGVTSAIGLAKYWRERTGLRIKTFPLELMVIELLRRKKSASLTEQLAHVFHELRDNVNDISIEDPANPEGNDLSGLLDATARADLSYVARSTLNRIEAEGWQSVFGPVEKIGQAERREGLRRAAAVVPIWTRPWAPGR